MLSKRARTALIEQVKAELKQGGGPGSNYTAIYLIIKQDDFLDIVNELLLHLENDGHVFSQKRKDRGQMGNSLRYLQLRLFGFFQ